MPYSPPTIGNSHYIPFGLDISDHYLRAVQLKSRSGKSFAVKTFSQLALPEGIIKNGEIIAPDKLISFIQKLLATPGGQKINSNEVIIALPEPKTFIKMVTFKWPRENKEIVAGKKKYKKNELQARKKTFYQILAVELEEDVPIPLEESTFDYHFIKGNIKKAQAGEELQLLIGIAPKKIADDYAQILEKSGLVPVALEIEGFAIARSIIKNQSDLKKEEKIKESVKIIIDLGATRTGLIIYYNNLIRYSLSISISGKQITQKISQAMNISFVEAEKIKLACDLNQAHGQEPAGQILSSSLEQIIKRLKEASLFCQLKISGKTKPQIILCGGGANWPGLKEFLNKKLELDVTVANPWINLPAPPENFPPGESLSYTTAIGLSLAGLYDYS